MHDNPIPACEGIYPSVQQKSNTVPFLLSHKRVDRVAEDDLHPARSDERGEGVLGRELATKEEGEGCGRLRLVGEYEVGDVVADVA